MGFVEIFQDVCALSFRTVVSNELSIFPRILLGFWERIGLPIVKKNASAQANNKQRLLNCFTDSTG